MFNQMSDARVTFRAGSLLALLAFAVLAVAPLVACSGSGDGDGDSDDGGGATDPVSVSVADIQVRESDGSAVFVLRLSAAAESDVTVDFATLDYTALEDNDFQPQSASATIAAGVLEHNIGVPLVDDAMGEATEQFSLVLTNVGGGIVADAEAVATISDDDPLEAVVTYDAAWGSSGVFAQAATCAVCHRASAVGDTPAVMRYPNADGEDISPARQWRHSMMAHAFDDPYTQAKIQDEITLFADIAGFIEDKCLSCHAPMGRTAAHHSGEGLTDTDCALDDGCYRYDEAVADMESREGVSCTLCHQVRELNLGSAESFSGGYDVAANGDADALTIYGPYQNPHPGGSSAMQTHSGYTPQFGNHVTTSGHCATCHTLYTPTVDVDSGDVTANLFLEQAVYLEWQNSAYAAGQPQEMRCQACHMLDPEPGGYDTRIALTPNGSVNANWPERTPFFTHTMAGGNSYMLRVMKDNRELLGIGTSTSAAEFDTKIAQTRELLQQAASVTLADVSAGSTRLDIDATVANRTGHKLPTSYPSRRVWLHLAVHEGSGAKIFESGAPSATGRLSSDAASLQRDCLLVDKPEGFASDACYESHHDIIDHPSQVQIYESVMHDSNGELSHVLLHAAGYLKDNRIPPQGFTAAAAANIESLTLPVGVEGDADFNSAAAQEGSGTDIVHYRVDTAGAAGPFTVRARLLYQTVRPSFVWAMRSDAGRVNRFKALYERTPPVPEVLAEATLDIP